MGDQQDLTHHQTPTAETNTIMNKLLLISLFLTITLISISTAQNGQRRPSNGQQQNSRKLESMKNPNSKRPGNFRNLRPGQKEDNQNMKNQAPNKKKKKKKKKKKAQKKKKKKKKKKK